MVRIYDKKSRRNFGPYFDTVGAALAWGQANISHDQWQVQDIEHAVKSPQRGRHE